MATTPTPEFVTVQQALRFAVDDLFAKQSAPTPTAVREAKKIARILDVPEPEWTKDRAA